MECFEYLKVDLFYGKCKICLFIISWCFEINDMVGGGKLYDNFLLDVVLNVGNMKVLKFVLVINWLVIL